VSDAVVAYVSGHGFGHSAREIEVLRHLPADIPLVVKSSAPEWFWRAELARPFTFVAESFDVGCAQKDALAIDVPATLAAWRAADARNDAARLAAEGNDLRRRDARVVVSDVPAFPLLAARRVGVPSVLVANFTWADIYAGLADEEPAFGPVSERIADEYRAADPLLLEAGFALPMAYVPRREVVGLVARPGADRRAELLSRLPSDAHGRRLALVYVGAWGMPLDYGRLAMFPDWHFLTLDLLPAPDGLPNLTVADRGWMAHPDLVASVDLVVSKLGYGIAGECVRAGTPILFPPRPGFAEHPVIEREVTTRGLAVPLPADAFASLDWASALAAVPARGAVPPGAAPGGPQAAEVITRLYRGGR
jgi:hypothetical protein